MFYCLTFKYRIVQNLDFRSRTNLNSNSNVVEGFSIGGRSSKKFKEDDDIFVLIDRKLKGLTEELGGEKGQKEVKEILTNTKKICDLECAKCMMNMIEDNKGIKSIDINKLSQDDSSEDCRKCKSYTSLSKSIQNMIDSL
jgi:hypothetical protein